MPWCRFVQLAMFLFGALTYEFLTPQSLVGRPLWLNTDWNVLLPNCSSRKYTITPVEFRKAWIQLSSRWNKLAYGLQIVVENDFTGIFSVLKDGDCSWPPSVASFSIPIKAFILAKLRQNNFSTILSSRKRRRLYGATVPSRKCT